MSQRTNACPYPDNEPARVQAVRAYEVLDTPPEPEFDALARVAAHTFEAPMAVVALMDADRLWFKSRLGLDVPQLDREIAFCAHAIAKPDQPLVVPDLRDDPRFLANPLVHDGPRLRFYAGAPSWTARAMHWARWPCWTRAPGASRPIRRRPCETSPRWSSRRWTAASAPSSSRTWP